MIPARFNRSAWKALPKVQELTVDLGDGTQVDVRLTKTMFGSQNPWRIKFEIEYIGPETPLYPIAERNWGYFMIVEKTPRSFSHTMAVIPSAEGRNPILTHTEVFNNGIMCYLYEKTSAMGPRLVN